jgi:transposase
MHPATVYRLLKRVRAEGEMAYRDQRHGHPIKLRGEVRTFLIQMCQATPSISSPLVQQALQERFGLSISVSQLNRVRASLGLSRRRMPREKKSSPFRANEPGWQEGAGGLLLLAAATETRLITPFCEAFPTEGPTARPPLAASSAALRQRLLLTLLFLGAAGVPRTWDLR